MTSTVLDRREAPPCQARFPKPAGVPRVESPSLACADITHDRPRQSRNPGGFALAVVERILALVLVWSERGRARRLLAGMSERELQDIGICRSDIANEIAQPFWRAFAAANAAR